MISETVAHPIIVVLWVIFLIYCVKQCMRPKNFPNGPILFPFIGSAWTIPAKGMEFKITKWKKKYGNFIGHKLFYEKMVVFCGSEEIVEGLKHPNFQGRYRTKLFLQRTNNQPLGFFFGDGETWSEVRRFTMRYFGTVFTTELETILHDEILEEFSHIQTGVISIYKRNRKGDAICISHPFYTVPAANSRPYLQRNQRIDGKFMKSPLNVILRLMTGSFRKHYESQIDDLQDKTEKAFVAGRIAGIELVYPFLLVLFNNNIQIEAINAAHGFLKDRLDEHRKSFNPLDIKDYADAFINENLKEFQLHGKAIHFTDDEFLSCGIDMIQAGNESTGKTIEFILMYVAMNERVQNKLHEEIDQVIGHHRYPSLNDRMKTPYLEATIYEGMRINPIAPNGVIHRVTEDTHFKGYFFEKDSLVIFALKYAMYDPEKWENPEQFIPNRFMDGNRSKKKLPNFGLGKRSCIGEVLVKNFMYLYLAYFFQRFSIRLPIGYKPSTEPILGFTNGPKPFKVIISEREIVKK